MIILNKLNLNNFQFILLATLPLAFVIGPLIVELIVNVLIVIFIFNVFKSKNFDFIKNKNLLYYFILFYFTIKSFSFKLF